MRDDKEEDSVRSILGADLRSYPELRRTLSGEISPEEAEKAKILASDSIRAFYFGLATIAVLSVLMPQVDLLLPPLASLIRTVLPTAICLYLISSRRVNFAGRMIFPLAALLMPSELDRNSSLQFFGSGATNLDDMLLRSDIELGVRMLLGFLLGWMLDGTANQDSKRPKFAVTLTVTFFLWAILVALFSPKLGIGETIWHWLRSMLVIGWIWWLNPFFKSADRYSRSDVATVFFASLARWRRRATGRFLAVVSVSIVLLATINGFALSSALSLKVADPPVTARIRFEAAAEPVEAVFFWTRMGRLLRESDFSVPNRHVYVTTSMAPKESADLDLMWTLGTLEPVTEASFKHRHQALDSYGVKSSSEFQQSLDKSIQKPWSEQRVWLIERKNTNEPSSSAVPSASPVSPDAESYVREALHKRMKPVSMWYLERFQQVRPIAMLGSGIFASFALVILWRRGGDSAAAGWVGVWFAGIAASFAWPLAEFVWDTTIHQLADSARTPQQHLAVRGFFQMLRGIALLGAVLAIYGFAAWLAYLQLRPTVEHAEHASGRWVRCLTGRRAIICIASVSFIIPSWIVFKSYSSLISVTVASSIATMVGIAVVEFTRRKFGRVGVTTDSRLELGRGGAALFLVSQIFLVGSTAFRVSDYSTWSSTATYVFLALLIIYGLIVVLYLIRTDWLRISAGRDLSWLVTVILLPFVFELLNGALPMLLEPTGVFLPGAASYASLFLVVGLMQPLQRVLESALAFISSPGMRSIQREVDDILERSLSASNPNDITEQILKMFKRRGVERFSLWLRRDACHYLPEFEPGGSSTESLELSPTLCSRLLKVSSVIDTDAIHSEWDYFFEQFEIDRIATRTAARYIYPLRQGNSVWGLLFIADSPHAQKLAKDSFMAIAGQLGFAIARRPRR